jgi:hypothetical protein
MVWSCNPLNGDESSSYLPRKQLFSYFESTSLTTIASVTSDTHLDAPHIPRALVWCRSVPSCMFHWSDLELKFLITASFFSEIGRTSPYTTTCRYASGEQPNEQHTPWAWGRQQAVWPLLLPVSLPLEFFQKNYTSNRKLTRMKVYPTGWEFRDGCLIYFSHIRK